MSFIHSQHQSFSLERSQRSQKSQGKHSFIEPPRQKSMLKGILLAVISIICSSSIPPFVNLYKGVSVPTIGMWRNELSSIYCIPITWYLLKKGPKINTKDITWRTLVDVFIAATFFCIASCFFLASSRHTLYSHTMTLANSGGIFLIIISLIRFLPVNKFEIIGTCFVVGGILALINDSESTKVGVETNIFLGDSFALLSMPCYTMAFIFNSRAIQKLPSLVVFHCFSIIQFLWFSLYIIFFSGIELSIIFSRDPINGMFGWSDPSWILLSTLIIAPICGVLGLGCYVFLLDFFPPHIVNGIFLMEPFTGQLIGCILGQDGWPSAITYAGASLVTCGLGFTIFGNSEEQPLLDKETGDFDLDIELSQNSLL